MLLWLMACSPSLTLSGPQDLDPVMADFAGFVGDERLSWEVSEDPASTRGRGLHIGVVLDQDCSECFQLERDGDRVIVHAGDTLGAQYGAAAALEALGYRFYNPYDTWVPSELAWPDTLREDLQSPEMRRRGIHMHTLHPIEGLYDFWEPGEPIEEPQRVMDWVVKNRGNHIQWVSLDDINDSDQALADWQARTGEIIDYAHGRGMTTGLGVQLFAGANLQLAFDLVDDEDADYRPQMEQMWAKIIEETPFDLYNLSFGEFNDFPPEAFIAAIDLAHQVMKEQAPDAEMTTVLHVGDDLQVEYNGETMVYYLLAQYADPEITPWVHTVMFYNLYEDPGGAYHHQDFDQHRALLEQRLTDGEPVGYFPESAYWVAFDTPVPQYFPLYMHSRWHDMDQALARTGVSIDDHVLFSSGWEWGYWQNDLATLRFNWELPGSYADTVLWMFEPLGAGLGQVVVDTTELQREYLIEKRLAVWIAGVDNVMELGYGLGIVSQPERIHYKDFAALDEAARAQIEADIQQLRAYASALEDLEAQLATLELTESRYVREVEEGLAIDRLRAHHAADVAQGVLDMDLGPIEDASGRIDQARAIVDARHSDLADPDPERLLSEGENPTLYKYGYLLRAEELCFWERELIQARNVVAGESERVPGCSL